MNKLNIKNKTKKIFNCVLFKNLIVYTLLWLFLAIVIVLIYRVNGKNFIWNTDGLKQHILTLYNYRNILLTFFKSGHFSTFLWNIGLGMDMFSNYAYYIIGDIFSYASLLVPESYIFTFYSLLSLVRLYFVGVTFLIYCHYHGYDKLYSVIGALMYTFCSFNLSTNFKHPYFSNAVILLPLLLLSLERAIKENKYTFYTMMIAILFFVSFYFGVMLAVIIAIYGILYTLHNDLDIWKNDAIKNRIKRISLKLLKILAFSLLGIGISCFILLPTLLQFINSERVGNLTIYPYTVSYYRNFIASLLNTSSPSNYTIIGVQSIILISLPIFIRRRNLDPTKFWLLIILLIPLLVSQVGSIFLGFSFPNNRWSFVLPFIFSYVTIIVLSKKSYFDKMDYIFICLFILIYLLCLCVFDLSLNKLILFELSICFAILLCYIVKKSIDKYNKHVFSFLLLIIFVVGLIYTICYRYDVFGDKYVSSFFDSSEFSELLSTANYSSEGYDDAINYVKSLDSEYYRIQNYPDNYENISIYYDFNSIGAYYSITPSYVYNLSMDLSNANYYLSYNLKNFDYRTKILSLLGVKYIISTDENYVPYGYTLLEDYDGTASIYVNENYTGFATLYTSYITSEDYDKLSSLEKETILLEQNALDESVIETYDLEISEVNDTSEIITSLDYEITDTYNILEDNTITITSTSKNKIVLTIDDYEDSEIYVSIKGLSYEPYSKEEMINNSLTEESSKYDIRKATYNYKWYQESYGFTVSATSGSIKKSVSVYDYKTSAYYFERDEMLFNLGYDNSNGTITLTLNNTGTYTFDSIEVYALSMDGYEEDVDALNESNFELVEYDDNYMIATVNSTSNGVLQFATYYNDGWDVYVDGENVDTFESNTYFLGIYITEGEHTIELRYHTPYVKEGFIVSGICVVVTVSIHIISKKRKKIKNI